MFHKVKNVLPLPEFRLSVQFCEGVTKIYDVKQLFEKLSVFAALKDDPATVCQWMWVVMVLSGARNWIYPAMNCGSMVQQWQLTLMYTRPSTMPCPGIQTSRVIETNQSDISLKINLVKFASSFVE